MRGKKWWSFLRVISHQDTDTRKRCRNHDIPLHLLRTLHLIFGARAGFLPWTPVPIHHHQFIPTPSPFPFLPFFSFLFSLIFSTKLINSLWTQLSLNSLLHSSSRVYCYLHCVSFIRIPIRMHRSPSRWITN